MNKTGLSSADLRSRSGIGTVRRTSGAGMEDDLDKALLIEKKMAASRLIRRSVAETEADEIKAQADALEQKLRLQNIEGQLKGSGGNEFLVQLMDEVKDLKGQIAEQREAMTNQQIEALQGSLNAMAEELNNLRGGQGSMVQTVKEQIQEAKELVGLITPPEVTAPAGSEDRALAAYMVRSKLEEKQLDLKGKQIEYEREDRMVIAREEIASKERIAQDELRLKEQHFQQQDRFLTDTVPKLLPLVEKIATAISSKSGNAQASPMVLPLALPEGVEVATCQQCGTAIYYRQGMTRVICPNPQCLAEYELRSDDVGTGGDPETD